MLSDRDLNSLKYNINNELNKVDFWLRMNKLSLNYSKTNYIIYNNQLHKTCKDEFTIVMNKTRLQRENSIKYLGVIFHDKLCWANHIDNLSNQLNRFFFLYIYPPDSQESDGGVIHRVSNYPDLFPEMPRYCCPLVI